MSTFVNDNSGLCIVHGTVTYATGSPTLVDNDGSATIAGSTGGANTIVTFAHAFTSAPTVILTSVVDTDAPTTSRTIVLDGFPSTTAFGVTLKQDAVATNSTADTADGDGFTFVAIGVRNR